MSIATADPRAVTTGIPIAPPLPAHVSTWRTHRWTTAEFDSLLVDGYLREGSKTFLWDGEIIEPMPENRPHVNAQENLYRVFLSRLTEADWTTDMSHPLALREGYKPQPDLMVLIGPRSLYRRRTPAPADVGLIIEVSDTTYTDDVGEKLPAYAAAGIPHSWIVHLSARRVEAYAKPVVASGVGLYEERTDYPLDVSIPLVLDRDGQPRDFGLIAVADILKDSLEDA